jgi:hypothetical protein
LFDKIIPVTYTGYPSTSALDNYSEEEGISLLTTSSAGFIHSCLVFLTHMTSTTFYATAKVEHPAYSLRAVASTVGHLISNCMSAGLTIARLNIPHISVSLARCHTKCTSTNLRAFVRSLQIPAGSPTYYYPTRRKDILKSGGWVQGACI